MQDFLTFKTFITPTLLILFYYIGAFLMPLVSWKFIKSIEKYSTLKVSQLLLTKYFRISLGLFLTLLCMEICWRIIFEFMIAYFNMHDALVHMKQI